MSLLQGAPVSLDDLLAAREARAQRCRAAVDAGETVVSLSVVMPGPVKACRLTEKVAAAACSALDLAFAAPNWDARWRHRSTTAAGPEALMSAKGEPTAIKRVTLAIEDVHPLGRLFDLDVHAPAGVVTREALGVAPRLCLMCGQPAKACGRSRAHDVDDLLGAISEIVGRYEAFSAAR